MLKKINFILFIGLCTAGLSIFMICCLIYSGIHSAVIMLIPLACILLMLILLFTVVINRRVLLPYREFHDTLLAIPSPDSPIRLNENAGFFSPLACAVNEILDEFGHRQQQFYCADQRYRLMAKLSNDVTFEFDLINNTISDSTNWDFSASGEQFIEGTIS